MAGNNTLFMTEAESDRVRGLIQDQMQKCRVRTGQLRQAKHPRTLIREAVSSSLMQDLASTAFGMSASNSSAETMAAYAVGRPYSPCTTDEGELAPMNLSDLRMETHHRGRVLSLRRVSPVVELKASSWVVVQAESPEVERLEVFLHTSKHGQNILDSGSEFLVKEPYYTLNHQGEPTIRVDHPSDLVVFTYSNDLESWRNETWSSVPIARTTEECKERGNAALQEKDYLRAHTSYTEGINLFSRIDHENDTLLNDLYRNRSYINLLLQRFDEARADALSSTYGHDLSRRRLDAKAYYRAGSAAYSLGNFEEAKGYFEEQEKLEPNSHHAKLSLRRVGLRLQEQATGLYNLQKIAGSLSKSQGRSDIASFNGYTEIRESPGAGRGLFATQDINAKDIVMCEKAFCVVWGHEPGAFSALTCDLRDDAAVRVFPAGLHRAVVQKLLNNPSQISKILDLFGDYKGLGTKLHESHGNTVIDTFQVHDIIQRNAFGPGQQTEDEDISNASTGLWIRAAYINHSCVSNAERSYIGDLMILRATRKIAAGEEITQGYDESIDYDERIRALKRTWGFRCGCALCHAEEADGPVVRKQRRELGEKANMFVQKESAPYAKKITISKAKRLRKSLRSTYSEERYKGLPRRALLGIEEWLRAAGSR
ncbi:Fc.00g025650.m01.CDS01 [Cosmosporella sp. VM-42]